MGDISVILEKPDFDSEEIRNLIEDVLDNHVEVVFADPGYMRVLNRKYRHIDRATDVLTFDLALSEDEMPEGIIYVDGRLFPPVQALLERIFHGYLHLLGYTHDIDSDSEAMTREVDSRVKHALNRRG
jgi:probable rRNA maturation factor